MQPNPQGWFVSSGSVAAMLARHTASAARPASTGTPLGTVEGVAARPLFWFAILAALFLAYWYRRVL